MLVVAALGFADAGGIASLAWDRGRLEDGELWRLLTGHLVHANPAHLYMNLAGLTLVLLVFGNTLEAKTWAVVLLVAALCVSGVLLLAGPWPETYVGSSGVLHATFAAPLIVEASRSNRIAAALFAALWVKVALETAVGGSAVTENLIGMEVATVAHLAGALSGTIVGGYVRLARRKS